MHTTPQKKIFLVQIHSQKEIALALTSSSIVTIFLDGGRTAPLALKLHLYKGFAEAQTCDISKGSGMAKELQTCKLIV
ncbi:hypothetical protein HNY73_011442 [Argiope bruennichi]|uniref:ATP-dependent DNA helicase n=1 Tax=Argiope bruennichi TaxID=94029 RepID=A0A8T0F545_ARGBR|nr:hypothetical protein HNY73_011442 [Argiope bruennichi]